MKLHEMHKSTKQQGFTLIELMIVVAIIGILSSVAISAYQDYTKRAWVAESLNLASALKAGVAEYYATQGVWPKNTISAGRDYAGPDGGKPVLGVTVDENMITIILQPQSWLQYSSVIAGGHRRWRFDQMDVRSYWYNRSAKVLAGQLSSLKSIGAKGSKGKNDRKPSQTPKVASKNEISDQV